MKLVVVPISRGEVSIRMKTDGSVIQVLAGGYFCFARDVWYGL